MQARKHSANTNNKGNGKKLPRCFFVLLKFINCKYVNNCRDTDSKNTDDEKYFWASKELSENPFKKIYFCH